MHMGEVRCTHLRGVDAYLCAEFSPGSIYPAGEKGKKRKIEGETEKEECYSLTSCCYQVVPSDFLSIWSILCQLAVDYPYPSDLSQVKGTCGDIEPKKKK
jgi:hypothetical protein